MRYLSSAVAAIAIALCLLSGAPSAQDADGHLSGLVDTLARGERAYGVSTYDLSLENARSLTRADIDYVYVDMEHGPMDFGALHTFLLGMIDKQAIAAKRAARGSGFRRSCGSPRTAASRPSGRSSRRSTSG